MTVDNCRRINLKRKVFHKGGSGNKRFKRYKKTPKYIKDNVENQIAREKAKDVYEFSCSDDDGDDLGMGLEISDLPFLKETDEAVVALTQDTVRPLFSDEAEYDEQKLHVGLMELNHSAFRPNQLETIKRILQGRSTLFISPTGSGKSLCYQLPALLYWRHRKYITIVVSPLISLMEDQMINFPKSLTPVSLHSHYTLQQRRNALGQLARGEAQVVFVSPEAIVGGVLQLEDLKSLPPVGFVCVDEAHCLSEWSHNFRPAYMQFFSILREQLNIKTYLGLTATASRATTFAISRCLTINPETDVIGATTIPDNLMLSVSYESDKESALVALLKSHTFKILPSLIVYCNRREETERVASLIRTSMQNYSSIIEVPQRVKRNASLSESHENQQSSPDKPRMRLTWNAEAYHAGLSSHVRKRIQRDFIKGEIRVVVATIAFGMGINKSNVRAVIHYDMPSSFESYVQEIGRAGRDGKAAQCHMFLRADMTDVFYQQRNIYSSVVEKNNLKKIVDYVFKPCRCTWGLSAESEAQKKLDKMNEFDRHEISSWQRTDFTSEPKQYADDDSDGEDLLGQDVGSHGSTQAVKYVHKSVVNKHRLCTGHEVTFSIDEATEEVNLSPESIITFICQIQRAYPQLKIKQFAPIRSQCSILCYKGPEQMKRVSQKCKPLETALMQKRIEAKRNGEEFEIPNEIKFDIAAVARCTNKSVADSIKLIKKLEWDLVEETGRFRRSQVKVKFDVNSFHLTSVGDVSDQEKEEVHKFLVDYMKKYETVERNKVLRMYKTFKKHSISVDKMEDKYTRMTTSRELKESLNSYFNPSNDQYIADEANLHKLSESFHENDKSTTGELPPAQVEAISRSAREFIGHHGMSFMPRTIARIFQGISCPNYPAEHWGKNRKWWRIHTDVDFLKLQSLITDEWCAKMVSGKVNK